MPARLAVRPVVGVKAGHKQIIAERRRRAVVDALGIIERRGRLQAGGHNRGNARLFSPVD